MSIEYASPAAARAARRLREFRAFRVAEYMGLPVDVVINWPNAKLLRAVREIGGEP